MAVSTHVTLRLVRNVPDVREQSGARRRSVLAVSVCLRRTAFTRVSRIVSGAGLVLAREYPRGMHAMTSCSGDHEWGAELAGRRPTRRGRWPGW